MLTAVGVVAGILKRRHPETRRKPKSNKELRSTRHEGPQGETVTGESGITEKFTENKTQGKTFWLPCAQCNQENEHTVIVSADYRWSRDYDENFSVDAESNYQVIRCRCGNILFRHHSWCSENQDHEWDGHTVTIYPKREVEARPTKRFRHVPQFIVDVYEQTILAYNNESYILCAAGLRVIVEGVCEVSGVKDGPVSWTGKDGLPKVGRSNKLVGKIAGLCEAGILTSQYADILHEHRFLGNDAVHDLQGPAQRELHLAIEIIEHILEQIFVIPPKAESLKAIRLKGKAKPVKPIEKD